MEINISTLILTLINFVILVLLLKHFFWDKIRSVIEERQVEIDEKILQADEDSEKARMYLIKNQEILNQAREEGKKITERQKQKGDKIYEEIIQNAKNESASLIERANLEIEREKEKAEYEIKRQAVELAVELSVKALDETIDEETHRKLISDFIAKVGM